MKNFALTAEDVTRLLSDPSETARANTVTKIAEDLEKHTLTAEERKLAEEILRVLANDAALAVRAAIVESMKSSRQLPPDVAERLAVDVEALALPLLQASPMLSDPFLVEMVRASGAARQIAIAERARVNEPVVSSLVEVADEAVLGTLVANKGAEIAEHNLAYMLERFPTSDLITHNLVLRPQVPARILEFLVATVSDKMAEQIKKRPDYQSGMGELLLQGRERATLRMLGRGRSDAELHDVAQQLADSGRLSASLVLRALCLGDLAFFETCLAVAAKVPLKNARILIHDQGDAGLKALYERSKLFPQFLPAIRHALEVARETSFDGGPDDLARYRRRLIERILTNPRGMQAEDIEYLLDKLSDLDNTRAA